MIPNLFSKQEIPDEIPEKLKEKIREFSHNSDKEDFLKKSFFYITSKWGGGRMNLIYKLRLLFDKDISKIFNTKGYLHCTTMNFLLRTMLVKSGFFRDEDIELKSHSSWIVPHQYLKVKIKEGEFVKLDIWAYQFGVDYGKISSFSDLKNTRAIR